MSMSVLTVKVSLSMSLQTSLPRAPGGPGSPGGPVGPCGDGVNDVKEEERKKR